MKGLKLAVLALILVFLSGCNSFYAGVSGPEGGKYQKKEKRHGPPPHAPAHGYRYKHQGHDLEFHARSGVYWVLNVPETYFHKGLYIRISSDGRWFVSAHLDRGWRIAAGSEVPESLKTYKNVGRHKKDKSWKKKE